MTAIISSVTSPVSKSVEPPSFIGALRNAVLMSLTRPLHACWEAMLRAARRATAVAPPAKRSDSLRSAKFPQATNLAFRFPPFSPGEGLTVQTIFEGRISALPLETNC